MARILHTHSGVKKHRMTRTYFKSSNPILDLKYDSFKKCAQNWLCLLVTLYLTFVARSQRCKRIINSLTCNFHVLGRREGIGTCIHVDTSKAFDAMHHVALLHTINRKVSDVDDSLKKNRYCYIFSTRHRRTALSGARLCTRYSYSSTHAYIRRADVYTDFRPY